MNVPHDNGASLVRAMRQADENLRRLGSASVDGVLEEFGHDSRLLAQGIVRVRLEAAQLRRQIAYDYWPGA